MLNRIRPSSSAAKALIPCSLLAFTSFAIPAAHAQNQLWITQFGSSLSEGSRALESDGAGGVYAGGSTQGVIGATSFGEQDAWMARFDGSGRQLWIHQFGTRDSDQVNSFAPDGSGGMFAAGRTEGDLGGTNAGDGDPWIARYDGNGIRRWIRQFGTPLGENAASLATDGAGGAFVAGWTNGDMGGPNAGASDIYVARYDGAGNQLWIRQFGGSASEAAPRLARDGSGGVYVSGWTTGDFVQPSAGGRDAWIARYDANGDQLWIRQFGSGGQDYVRDVAPDGAGGAFIAGNTTGSFGAPRVGMGDPWIARYDNEGNQLWIRQLGVPGDNAAFALSEDGRGGAFLAGLATGDLGGPNAGSYDAWLAHYDSSGRQTWIEQFGTFANDQAQSLAFDGLRGAFIAGKTNGSLSGSNRGEFDVFLARYDNSTCYADCDQSSGIGVLDVFDFLCFQNSFVNAEPYACDCDTSTGPGVCDVFDFLCFQNAFVGGCP